MNNQIMATSEETSAQSLMFQDRSSQSQSSRSKKSKKKNLLNIILWGGDIKFYNTVSETIKSKYFSSFVL